MFQEMDTSGHPSPETKKGEVNRNMFQEMDTSGHPSPETKKTC